MAAAPRTPIGKELAVTYETIQLTLEGAVGTLILNRADKLNSFTRQMHEELAHALDAIASGGTVRALVLTGAGRGFCAGQDLADAEGDLGDTVDRYYNPLIRRLRALPLPVIAAVNGVAAGAGANLALACDIVLAGQSASFIQAFTKIGLVPDSGGTWTLPRLVGMARATALIMLGDKISAEQAAQWGMIWKCVPDADLLAEAGKLAAHLATQPTKGLALQKQALDAAWTNSLSQQLDVERDLQRQAGATADFREGVDAFMQKRAPKFQGR